MDLIKTLKKGNEINPKQYCHSWYKFSFPIIVFDCTNLKHASCHCVRDYELIEWFDLNLKTIQVWL